eukprot:TRINITY_DN9340_c0_g1_i1.p1 TRINITY_DN9340_c0_g1~~TRINITY_DN9340_c0_g1_i1.p1  ORF type:complete len:349 (+),score=51.78 TRINITY_DN9340_c0_g1_i1:277-1323(+)
MTSMQSAGNSSVFDLNISPDEMGAKCGLSIPEMSSAFLHDEDETQPDSCRHNEPNDDANATVSSERKQEKESAENLDECRICKEASRDGDSLIMPCACAGTVGLIHPHCLQKWIESRPIVMHSSHMSSQRAQISHAMNQDAPWEALICEVCQQPYQICYRKRFNCSLSTACSKGSCQVYVEAILIASAIPMLIVQSLWLNSGDPLVFPTRLLLALLNFTVFLLFPITMGRLFNRWLSVNSEVSITLTDSHRDETKGRTTSDGLAFSHERARKEIYFWTFVMASILLCLVILCVCMTDPSSRRATIILLCSASGGSLFSLVALRINHLARISIPHRALTPPIQTPVHIN